MRIIAGEWKGRKLTSPAGNHVRPTSDKVKEAMFNMIMQYTPGAVVLDLFAGSGNLGLEAASRGAERVYFGDSSRESLNLTKRNIETCSASQRTVCFLGDWENVLGRIHEKLDIVFLDPPYREGLLPDCIEKIQNLALMQPDGIIVVEYDIKQVLPDELHGFQKIKEKRYGTTCISIYANQ